MTLKSELWNFFGGTLPFCYLSWERAVIILLQFWKHI